VTGSGATTAFRGGRRTTVALLTVLVVLTVASGIVWWNVLDPGSATPVAAEPPATSPAPTASPAPTPDPSDGTGTATPEDDLPRAAVPLPDDQIVWRHNVGTDWTMSTVGPDGSRSRVVLASGEQEVAPLVSHDRRTVLYLRRERPGDRSSLHAVAADGSVQRLLFRDGTTSCPYLRQVAWSVDGTLALVCKIDAQGTSYTLSTARTDGTVVRTLDVGLIGGPTFSPDGRDLLYPKASSGSYKRGGPLYRTAVDGSTEPDKVVGGRNVTPAWAPRGTTIAFSRYEDDDVARVVTMPVDGGADAIDDLTADDTLDLDPTWSPDGGSLAFRRVLDDDRSRLVVMTSEGEEEHDLSRDGTVGAPSWTPR
jgi:hypothetical protein